MTSFATDLGGGETRIEQDSLGSLELPADCYYGVHTVRAIENFPITGTAISVYPEFIAAIAVVKQAAARANRDLGLLDERLCQGIELACEEIRRGAWLDYFPIDVIQGGAGTSANMNANEVICNRALVLLGHRPGMYEILDPLAHVNLGQSTNDVYPSAIRIAIRVAVERLLTAIDELREAFEGKAEEFSHVLKIGRTQLQEAVPITLGREFGSYAVMLGEDALRLGETLELIREINLGATAVGTGLNTHPEFGAIACNHLRELTGINLVIASDLIEATQDVGALVQVSGVLRRVAVKLSKVCNDLRLLSSGPGAGFAEIQLPSVQAGSSIMPGKVNPVIPEVVNQVAFEVIGNDVTVTMAAEAGQLQLNAFEPIILHSILSSVNHLESGCRVLADRCVKGITTDAKRLRDQVEKSAMIATALSPHLGYAAAASLVAESESTGLSVTQLATDRGLLDAAEIQAILSPELMLAPRAVTPDPSN